jgi:ribulose-bisphosphate carboxylase large chain
MEWLRATYLIRSAAADIEARCAALAVEQSVEMPLDAVRQPSILEHVVARVAGIEPATPGIFTVQLDLATSTIAGNLSQLVNMAFGNCSLQGDVTLVDLDLDPLLLPSLRGPSHGIAGLRRLVGATDGRAMTSTALKPQGLSPRELADLAAGFARAGIDLIKDDHGLADQAAAPFARRVAACQAAVAESNQRTGGSSRYAPSLVGGPLRVAHQARLARDEGVEVVLVAPMLLGLAGFAELTGSEPAAGVGSAGLGDGTGSGSGSGDGFGDGAGFRDLAVLAHPAFAGATAVVPPLLLGKLFRLAGADAVIFTNHGGRFAATPESCAALAHNARRPWGGLQPTLPVPAGGMTPARAEELVRFYGNDVALLVGGALLQGRPGPEAAARSFVAATRAASGEHAGDGGRQPATGNDDGRRGAMDRAEVG